MHVGEVSAEIRTGVFDVLSGAAEATCIVNPEMEVLWINPAMEHLASISAGDAKGSNVLRFLADRVLLQADEPSAAAILSSIRSRTEEEGIECRIDGPEGGVWYAYTSRRLEKGTLAGAWILTFREITAQKRTAREHERCSGDLLFLSRAATGLAALPPDAEIFAVIGGYIHELAPDSIIIVSEADVRAGTLTPRAFFGIEYCLPRVAAFLDCDITGITLNIPGNIREIMAHGEIAEIEGGLEAVALWQIPKDVCRKIEEIAGFGPMYCVPFTWKGEIFGTAVILTRGEDASVPFEAIDTFKDLASIALQRHLAEDRLRRSEERFRALIEKSSDFILIVDDQVKIRFASPPIERIDGISPQMLVGRSAFDMMLPEEVPRAQELMSRLMEKPGSSAPLEVRFRGPRGMHVIEAMVTNLLDDPQVRGVVVNARDITERKRAEEALQHRNTQLAMLNRLISVSASALALEDLLASALATSLALLNLDAGAVYLLNRRQNRATLVSQRGMKQPPVPKTITISSYPFEEVFVAGRQDSISAGDDIREAEKAMLDAFGVSSLTWIPLTAESRVMGALAVGSIAGEQIPPDVRWLTEAIGREIGAGILRGMLYEQLETANREANLYLDILTHDIRNVNSVATMYTDLLAEILEGEPKTYVLKMKSSIDKSTEILANVATIRKIHEERAPLKPIDLRSIIVGEQKNFPDTAIRYAGQFRTVWADDLLPEVFNNLIGNAVKFGGPDVVVMISVETADDSVVVTVADTGPGIPDDLKEAIFHRFERGQTRARGEGLGLYICHKLLERYGGRIWVEDRVPGRPEMGAALRFTLKEAAQ